MRAKSLKRQKADRSIREAEEAFAKEFYWCWECRFQDRSLHIHHIASGGARGVAKQHRSTWMRLCGECHATYHARRDLGYELAVKLFQDPDYFDRSEVLKIMGKADTAITMQEVMWNFSLDERSA